MMTFRENACKTFDTQQAFPSQQGLLYQLAYLKENLISVFLPQSLSFFTHLTTTKAMTSDLSSLVPQIIGGFDWLWDMRDCGIFNWKGMSQSSSLRGIADKIRVRATSVKLEDITQDHPSGEDPPRTPYLVLLQDGRGMGNQRGRSCGYLSGWRMGGSGQGTLSESCWSDWLCNRRRPFLTPLEGSTGLRLTRLLAGSTCCWCRNTLGGGHEAVHGRCRQSSRVWCPRHLGEGRKETPVFIASANWLLYIIYLEETIYLPVAETGSER